MKGRYLIYTPLQSGPNERRFDANWHTFTEVCRSLHRDGLDYSVQSDTPREAGGLMSWAASKAVGSWV